MSSKIECPVCKSKLQKITMDHISTLKHQKALKKAGIAPKLDPSLKLIKKKPIKSKVKNQTPRIAQIDNRISILEKVVNNIEKRQNELFSMITLLNKGIKPESSIEIERKIKEKDVLRAINQSIRNNESRSRWVKLDDVISIMRLNREQDRMVLNKMLINMFNKNTIDLAEGGDPKYPLIFQNRIFGMLTIQ